jgi:hypothetical protein
VDTRGKGQCHQKAEEIEGCRSNNLTLREGGGYIGRVLVLISDTVPEEERLLKESI